ncbi:hypothetical protein FKM82_011672 [Ascaphus truei]
MDYGMSQASAPSLVMSRSPGFGSGFLPSAEMAQAEPQQAEPQYPARGMYPDEMLSVARPRPLGSTAGSAQIHQLTQVGIASRMGAQATELPPNRVGQPQPPGPTWSSYYHPDEEAARTVPYRDPAPSSCYPSGSAEDLHPGHSSASLIKAIREELLRLSQKQAAVPSYHS